MGPCLDAEVLAAYLDHGLSLAERARVDVHLASCPHCVAMLAGVARTVADLSAHLPAADVTAEATPWMTRRAWAGALGAAAAVIAVLLMPTVVRHQGDRDAGLVSLVGTVREQRSVLGRLTGGFPHAPLGRPSAGGQDGQAAGNDRIELTAGRIRESVGERMSPAELHTLGVSQLLAGKYDEAAMSLMAASREQPANAKYLSDVAAVQLERGRRGLRPDDLPRALASANRALRLDASLSEAQFNRALALTALSFREDAKASWSEYLKHDSSSPWATEARSRIDELRKPTAAQAWTSVEQRLKSALDSTAADEAVRAQTTEARNFIETTLLVNWANAVLSGGSGSSALEPLRVMAESMSRVAGDALYADTVEAIDRAGSGLARTQLAQAHRSYASAAATYNNDQFALADPALRKAASELSAAGSPYVARPVVDIASLDYLTGRYDAANEAMSAALQSAKSHKYGFVAGRASWIIGISAFMQGRFGDARANYEDSLGEFERLGDAEQVAAAHNLLAALFTYIGDQNAAWEHMTPALRGLDVTRSLRLRHGLLINAALTVRSVSEEAALAIQDEVVRNAIAWGRDAAISEAFAQRASILASLNRGDEASRDLSEARRQMASSADASFKPRLETTVLATESDLLRRTNPTAAVKAAEGAIALASSRGDRLRVAQLQLRLAKANLALGRTQESRLALERGIAVFEEERRSMTSEALLSSRDELWGLFETSVQLAIKQQDVDRAFDLAERARVRTLAEAKTVATPRSLKAIEQSLDANEALIAINQFDDEVALWVIRPSGSSIVTRRLARGDAERLSARQQDEIRAAVSEPVAGRDLYDALIRPLSAQLKGATRLIVVPDQTYETVSFAGLWNNGSKRYLVQDVSVRLAPSASGFAWLHERIHERAATGAVAVGAGEQGAVGAQAVAALYPSASLLVGSAATRPRLIAEADSHAIVHLSAPVFTSAKNPLLSRLQIADEGGLRYSGLVSGIDIAGRPMNHTQVVVIDEVPGDSSHRGDGTLSIARAFITAGVPAVIGTLPGTDAAVTRNLLIGFHREIAGGLSAEEAIQKVQRNVIEQNGGRLGAWSALVIYGSDR